ncbi:GumC family protein [Hymenobacter sp. HDW8]|uniref:GumC family protein n=1 Tax=Hymenobacter sp. HDW8 TaxID=2714932 RepID=UPI00140B3AD0|nr:polysaccharide biosynthesis tyrosine autokinase [Hymenobacter sp. HDW8]QIL77335.1 AAA family ATPase [Hymenobacter sp. HDW8]
MKPERRSPVRSDVSLIGLLASRYIPYWPLYALLCASLFALAFIATKYIVPVYRINATLVINDKAKGVEESETLRSLNVYAANKTVENEVQVLKSRTLINTVVHNLRLYAPTFEVGRLKAASAYLSSPVRLEVQNPASLKPQKQVLFTYDSKAEQVRINGQAYSLQQWEKTPYGVLRFSKNPAQKRSTDRPLYFSLLDPKEVTDDMITNLEVSASSKLSSVVAVQYTDAVPERGEAIVNSLLEVYNRASAVNNNQLASNTLTFITDRVRLVERELDSIQNQIQKFKSSQNVVDLSQQGQLYLQNVAENDREIAEINTQLAVLDKVEDYMRAGGSRTGIVPTTLGISDPVLADLLQKVNELELRQANLSTSSGANHPLTRAVESEIQEIKPGISNIVRSQRNRLLASRGTLAGSSGQYNSVLRTLPSKERELLEISRQQAIKSDVYAFLLKRKEEAELSSASNLADNRVVDRAEASVKPVASKRILVLLGALLAGFALSTAYVFIKEEAGGKVMFRSTLEKATTLPVVGEISSSCRFWLRRAVPPAVIARQFEQLQAALGFYDSTRKQQSILVTSHLSNEGKTFVSTQLAESLAVAGYKTILLDLNLHAPETTHVYGLTSKQGADDFLRGTAQLSQIIHATSTPGLDVLGAGSSQAAASLYLSPAMEQLFDHLRATYEYIVIDTPPIELAIDAYILSRWSDVSMLIVRQGFTPLAIVQHLDENNKLLAMPNLSIVFNAVKPRGFLTSYTGYGYGYGYQKVYKGSALSTKLNLTTTRREYGVPIT